MTNGRIDLNAIAAARLAQVTAAGRAPIIRVWHGITSERVAEEYFIHIRDKGIPAYRAVEGNLRAYVLRRTENSVAEFLVISIWDSWDAIRRFTQSNDPNAAIYYEQDDRLLMFKEPRVAHFELALWDGWLPIARFEHNAFEGTS